MKNKKLLGFIGLGRMGGPMAAHLVKAGHQLIAYNRSPQKRAAWTQYFQSFPGEKPQISGNLLDLAACSIIFLCINADADVEECISLLKPHLAPKSIVVDHSTISAKTTQKLHARLKKLEIDFIDAPISGGQEGAEKGVLSIMAGGEESCFQTLKPYFQCYAKNIHYLGPSGNGQLTKMVNQIFITGILTGLSEGLVFAKAKNLPIEKLTKALGGGAAQSWQLDNRGLSMQAGQFDFGFAINLMIKDLRYAAAEAQSDSVKNPELGTLEGLRRSLQRFQNLQERGMGDYDVSAFILSYLETALRE